MLDICLCEVEECCRNCLRNITRHDLRDTIYFVSCFERAPDFTSHETCPYFLLDDRQVIYNA